MTDKQQTQQTEGHFQGSSDDVTTALFFISLNSVYFDGSGVRPIHLKWDLLEMGVWGGGGEG